MTDKDKTVLAHYGWVVECESPVEIRHPDGSFATRQAAEYVLLCLGEEYSEQQYENQKRDRELEELRRLEKKYRRDQ